MNTLLILPVAVPMIAAALMLILHRRAWVQRRLGVLSALVQFVTAVILLQTVREEGILTTQLGGWPARYGITFVADLFAAFMVLLSGTIALAAAVYSTWNIDRLRRVFGFYPLMQILLMGANGAFLTGDLFNLYVWFEVLLISSFVLLVLGNERPQMEGALKYVTLNLIASMLFLTAIGILYGSVNALNMADIAIKMPLVPPSMTGALATLLLVAFGIKAAVFPLFFWLPDSYHTPPATVTALFAGLLTKVGVYSLIRIFTLFFPTEIPRDQTLLLVIAGGTMALGVLGAVAQTEVRRILAFHSVSQVGYMVMGFALYTASSLAGALYFILHHGIVKSNLFLICGVIERRCGSSNLKQIGGVMQREPLLATLFFVTALSLAGIPPLSGFWAKLGLVQSGLEIQSGSAITIVLVSLAVGLMTLISMIKIWTEGFWKPAPADPTDSAPGEKDSLPVTFAMYAPILALAALSIGMGACPELFLQLSREAAGQLINPQEYLDAVLGAEIHESARD